MYLFAYLFAQLLKWTNYAPNILPVLPYGLFPDVSAVFARLEEMESVNAGLQWQLEALQQELDALSSSSESPDLSHTVVQTAVTDENATVTTCSSVNGEKSPTTETEFQRNETSQHAADIGVPVVPGVDERALLEGDNPTEQGKAPSNESPAKQTTADRMNSPVEATKYCFNLPNVYLRVL